MCPRLVPAFAIATLFCSCSEHTASEPEVQPRHETPDIVVEQVIGSDSPVFLVASDQQNHAVAFLADKDPLGNPLEVTGVAFTATGSYVAYLVDRLGRPRKIATEDMIVMFSDYTSDSVRVDSYSAQTGASTRVVALSSKELDAIRVVPPSLEGSVGVSKNPLQAAVVGGVRGTPQALTGADVTGAIGAILAEFARLTLDALDCTNAKLFGDLIPWLLPSPACQRLIERFGPHFATLFEGLKGFRDAVPCVLKINALVAAVASGAGIVLTPALAFGLVATCTSAVMGITRLIKEGLHEARFVAGFKLKVRGDLRERKPSDLSLALVPEHGDGRLHSVVVDLQEVGGSSRQSMKPDSNGIWVWSGSVTPTEGGVRLVHLIVDGRAIPGGTPVVVIPADRSPLSVALTSSASPIQLGEQVTLDAQVSGGTAPYTYLWRALYQGIRGHDFESHDASLRDSPRTQVRYQVALYDQSPIVRFGEAELWVDVCGDRECTGSENAALCRVDCADKGTDSDQNPTPNGDVPASHEPTGDHHADEPDDTDEPDAATPDAGDQPDASADGGTSAPSGADDQPPSPPDVVAAAVGDPHLRTFDGALYDCQPKGEETLVRSTSDDLEVQIRTAQWGSSNASVIVAVAARVAGDVVVFYADGSATLNHVAATFEPGATPLEAGGSVWKVPGGHLVIWPDGSQLQVTPWTDFISLRVFLAAPRAGHVAGLLGNANGTTEDDLTTRDGEVKLTSPVPFAPFYGTYVESWRITQATSLFDYKAGESTQTWTDRAFPARPATTADLDASVLQDAMSICDAAHVSAAWMEACVLDVGLSNGDVRFANALATPPASVQTTIALKAPAVGGASCSPPSPRNSTTGCPGGWLSSVNGQPITGSTCVYGVPQPVEDFAVFVIDTTGLSGTTLDVALQVGNGASSASLDLFTACQIVPTHDQVPSVVHAPDKGPGSLVDLTWPFTPGDLFQLGIEGNWFSPTTAQNTVSFTISSH